MMPGGRVRYNLPKMLWTGVDPLVRKSPFALERASQSHSLLARFIAADGGADALEPLVPGGHCKAPKNGSHAEGIRMASRGGSI